MNTLLERKRKLVKKVDKNVTLIEFRELKKDWWALWYFRMVNGRRSHGCVYEERAN